MHLKPAEVKQPKEHRIKVALKDKSKNSSKKSAAVKNKIKRTTKEKAMPKGKQLENLPQKSKKTPPKVKKQPSKKEIKEIQKKIKRIEKQITKAKKSKSKKVQKQRPINKKIIRTKEIKKYTKEQDVNITKKPIKKTGLYANLSKPQKTTAKQENKKKATGTQIGKDFKEAYGEAFGKLSEGEKKYVIDNQEVMRRITQEQLNRLAPVNIPRNLRVNTMNIIEFYLYPNGDISGLKIITPSSVQLLDDTSLQTIEYSYHRYPLPKQKTLIRYKVGYWLGGRRY